MSKTILIIDDDPYVVLFLSTLLIDHGYSTIDAADGLEGMNMARENRPDLILLDLMMPRKSGIAMLADLENEETLNEIPVIMVTGVSGETGIEVESFFQKKAATGKGNSMKPIGYIEKPVDPERLLKLIEAALE